MKRIRQGSVAEIKRLLGIGEKRVHLNLAKAKGSQLPEGAFLPANEPMDILDAISNVDLSLYISTMDRAVSTMEVMLGKETYFDRIPIWMRKLGSIGLDRQAANLMLKYIDRMLHSQMK